MLKFNWFFGLDYIVIDEDLEMLGIGLYLWIVVVGCV